MLHFNDRTRILEGGLPSGDFVLYWMRTAVRIDHNPALITALELGKLNNKPVLVYHAVSERYPFASARHHTFIIEGAQEVSKAFEAAGINYAFHVERKGHRGPHLETLAKQALAVVTEDMPVPFLQHWTEHIAEKSNTTMYLVDTDCIVPMKLSRKAPTRAFQFRDRFKSEREHRLHNTTFPELGSLIQETDWEPTLPFEPVDLNSIIISDLVEECEIDQTVFPVSDTKGGSSAAQARWRAFKDKTLSRYHKMRNDPLRKGVSRMSAYLHYGMISSFQLATESLGYGAGGEKYRDELLIWRELAHHWCSKTPMPQHWRSLPEWARKTLEAHQSDVRLETYSWEQLRNADTEDELWNLCQKSLNVHGELHNNLRMTWGKQLIEWCDNPRTALRMVLDLNNRFALDGRDPSSYGGILWCFGLFDRPFSPERSIWGSIRSRTTVVHAERLNVATYKALINKPIFTPSVIRYSGPKFIGALLVKVLTQYQVYIDFDEATPTIDTWPEIMGTNTHRSKLSVLSWKDAKWIETDGQAINWTEYGKRHFQNIVYKSTPPNTGGNNVEVFITGDKFESLSEAVQQMHRHLSTVYAQLSPHLTIQDEQLSLF